MSPNSQSNSFKEGNSDAHLLEVFFSELSRDLERRSGQIQSFFDEFEVNYRAARSDRRAGTPHLDVLRVFGLEFAELRHSAVLAWFLDCEAEHEQGALFANALVRMCNPEISKFPERYTVRRERHQRTDVSLYASGHFTVFVENKVRHTEREEQVSDMVKSLCDLSKNLGVPRDGRFAVFLTDHGISPITGPVEDSADFFIANLKSLRRLDIFEAFRAELKKQGVCSPLLMNFLDSYIGAIRRIRTQITKS